MSLHHRREIADMRSAYGHDRASARTSESQSERSYRGSHTGSSNTSHTPPTSYSSSPVKRSPIVHNTIGRAQHGDVFFNDRQMQESPKSSIESCASTVQSEEVLLGEVPEYEALEYTERPHESTALAACPSEFSQLFPSRRQLVIHHDDSIDANMNLRVDTEVPIDGERCEMTLFHLRMHDLRNREFSLRRYCRDSGREVCHSSLRSQKSTSGFRPGIQRSLSNALNSIRPKSAHRSSTDPNIGSLKRHDSGYGSMHSVDFDEDDRPTSAGKGAKSADSPSTNTTHLEFSNYAQVDVKCTGNSNKRYEFEYWGVRYSWRRVLLRTHGTNRTSFQLIKAGSDRVLAHIVPLALSSEQAAVERAKAGWIPPCSMWIADESIVRSQKDLSDVVVAAGLIALVDDEIRAQLQSKIDVEYSGAKRLINEMLNRSHTLGSQSRPTSSGRS